MPPQQPDVILVGAGLAGLACARDLAGRGLRPLVLEASSRVGGRIVTDTIDGFRIDRGFQVLLTSYPEARRTFDFAALELASFRSGALVRRGGRNHRVSDPWRAPWRAFQTLAAPFVSFGDGLRLAQLRRLCVQAPHTAPDGSARAWLEALGFSSQLREAFLRPFFSGVTLEPQLEVPARRFARLFGWFSTGTAALPANGMQALPEQLAAGLPEGALRTSASVAGLDATSVTLASGERWEASAVVVATDGRSAARLLQGSENKGPQLELKFTGTTGLAFAAPASPVPGGLLHLCGDGKAAGPVVHVSVPSDVHPSYAPADQALVVATCTGVPAESDEALEAAVRHQLRGWYGAEVDAWRLLRLERIPDALPLLDDPVAPLARPAGGPFVCGDHTQDPSIQGTLESARRTAEAVSAKLAAIRA